MTDGDNSAQTEPLPEEQRRAIFLRVVELQDGGLSVPASREECAREYKVQADQVQLIEREGISSSWPPLD